EVNSAQYLYWGIKAHRWTTIGITLFIIGLVGATAMLVRYYWRVPDHNERRLEYANKIKLAAQALETSNLTLARNLLDEVVPKNGEPDFRSFEWGYLNRLFTDRSASQPQVLTRDGWVSAVAFSPDTKHLATAGADNIITLWDVLLDRPIKTFAGHSEWITSVQFSPDGGRLLTGGFDGTAKVWDVESGSEVLTLTADGAGISKPFFCKNGTAVIALGNDAIRIWDSTTGKESEVVHEPAKGNMAFAFSPDEKLYALRDVDQNISVIDIADGKTVARMKGHTDLVTDIKFSGDSRFLLTGSVDATARLWEVKTGKQVRIFKGHTETILAVAFSPDGKMIATGSNDDTLKIWSAEDGFLIDTLRGHTGDIGALDFSSDGRRLASGGNDNRIRIWPVSQNPPQGVLRGHTKPINSLAFSKDSSMLASTSEDGTARIWDTDSERERLLLDHDAVNVLPIAFSHDGKVLGTGGPKFLKLWSTINGREVRTIPTEGRINSIEFSSDDRMIATTDKLQIWDPATGQSICSTEYPAWTAEFMADTNRILTSGGSSIGTWDVRTCTQITEFEGEKGSEYAAVYSKTGKPWAFQVLNESRSLKLIDAITGAEIASFFGHEAELWAVDFTQDGKRLATADVSGLIKIWDVPSGHELLTLKANVGALSSIAISPDGKTLAASGHDGIVRLFRSTF
ncbi:MAG: WD40 repeat domain-containing protein, partial [bacterium]|nr:WD40 repeat domain-containing protein [bacterium]